MLKVLVPVDGSTNALKAVHHTLIEYQRHHELEIHLLNVQPNLPRDIARFIGKRDRRDWQQERASQSMQSASQVLTDAGVPHEKHWSSGDRATEICRMARDLGVHHIVMGTARKNSLTRMLEDSVTNRVLENIPVPVEVIAGRAVSKWERWGVPAGLAAAGGLIFIAVD